MKGINSKPVKYLYILQCGPNKHVDPQLETIKIGISADPFVRISKIAKAVGIRSLRDASVVFECPNEKCARRKEREIGWKFDVWRVTCASRHDGCTEWFDSEILEHWCPEKDPELKMLSWEEVEAISQSRRKMSIEISNRACQLLSEMVVSGHFARRDDALEASIRFFFSSLDYYANQTVSTKADSRKP